MLPTGPAGPVVWPRSNSETRPCQMRWLFDSTKKQRPRLAAVRQCRVVSKLEDLVVPERAEEVEPNQPKFGWQKARVAEFGDEVLESARVASDDRCREGTLLRSQRGPLASRSSDRSSNHLRRRVPLFWGTKCFFLGHNVPRRWCHFGQKAFFGYKKLFWDQITKKKSKIIEK